MAGIPVQSDRKTHTQDFTPADEEKAVFFGNAQVDNLFTAVAALGAEVWALRRRMKITESLMTKHGAVTTKMIEDYIPSDEEKLAWGNERNEFVATLFESFT